MLKTIVEAVRQHVPGAAMLEVVQDAAPCGLPGVPGDTWFISVAAEQGGDPFIALDAHLRTLGTLDFNEYRPRPCGDGVWLYEARLRPFGGAQ